MHAIIVITQIGGSSLRFDCGMCDCAELSPVYLSQSAQIVQKRYYVISLTLLSRMHRASSVHFNLINDSHLDVVGCSVLSSASVRFGINFGTAVFASECSSPS